MEYFEVIAVIAGFAIIFIPLLIWILSQIVKMKESMGKVSENIGRLDERVKIIEKSFDRWQAEIRENIVELYKIAVPKKTTSNPISPEEKEKLLKKLQAGTLSKEEAERLKSILEKEKREAEAAGNIGAAIVIGLLLGALAYLLYKLLEEG